MKLKRLILICLASKKDEAAAHRLGAELIESSRIETEKTLVLIPSNPWIGETVLALMQGFGLGLLSRHRRILLTGGAYRAFVSERLA